VVVHLCKVSDPLIFVVDDESIIAETLMILERSSFQAKAFMNPLEALSAATAESDPPDMLISDVIMQRLSGVNLAIKIKEFCPSCNVLLFSGQAQTM
jgi:DNA-binding NtrC family response regulator